MNKKSSLKNKVLLDTSFLLPILGFQTSDRVMKAFQKLGSYELYYNDISLLEALWKIVKVIEGTEKQISRIKEGIRAIEDTMIHVSINEASIENAIYMYKLGHRDMVDNLLYSIALSNDLKLLTVDKELIEFINKHDLARHNIISPEEL